MTTKRRSHTPYFATAFAGVVGLAQPHVRATEYRGELKQGAHITEDAFQTSNYGYVQIGNTKIGFNIDLLDGSAEGIYAFVRRLAASFGYKAVNFDVIVKGETTKNETEETAHTDAEGRVRLTMPMPYFDKLQTSLGYGTDNGGESMLMYLAFRAGNSSNDKSIGIYAEQVKETEHTKRNWGAYASMRVTTDIGLCVTTRNGEEISGKITYQPDNDHGVSLTGSLGRDTGRKTIEFRYGEGDLDSISHYPISLVEEPWALHESSRHGSDFALGRAPWGFIPLNQRSALHGEDT